MTGSYNLLSLHAAFRSRMVPWLRQTIENRSVIISAGIWYLACTYGYPRFQPCPHTRAGRERRAGSKPTSAVALGPAGGLPLPQVAGRFTRPHELRIVSCLSHSCMVPRRLLAPWPAFHRICCHVRSSEHHCRIGPCSWTISFWTADMPSEKHADADTTRDAFT